VNSTLRLAWVVNHMGVQSTLLHNVGLPEMDNPYSCSTTVVAHWWQQPTEIGDGGAGMSARSDLPPRRSAAQPPFVRNRASKQERELTPSAATTASSPSPSPCPLLATNASWGPGAALEDATVVGAPTR
jgi:hypothetical protein